jgi:hypothetical protein
MVTCSGETGAYRDDSIRARMEDECALLARKRAEGIHGHPKLTLEFSVVEKPTNCSE